MLASCTFDATGTLRKELRIAPEQKSDDSSDPDPTRFLAEVDSFARRMEQAEARSMCLGNRANSWTIRLTIAAAFFAFGGAIVSGFVASSPDQGLLDSPEVAAILGAAAGLATNRDRRHAARARQLRNLLGR